MERPVIAAEPDGSEILGLLVILFSWNCRCWCTFGWASDYFGLSCVGDEANPTLAPTP